MDRKIEKTTLDGRRAEIHSFEQSIDNGTQRVTEHYEEIVPFQKQKRIVEDVLPVVTQRVVEELVNGQLVRTVETVDQSHLIPTQPKSTLTSVDVESIESIIRRLINESNAQPEQEQVVVQPSLARPSFFGWGGRKVADPVPVPTPVPVVPAQANDYIGYIFVTLLAVEVAVIVWQLFIR